MIKLITTASKKQGAERLIMSARNYGWDLEFLTGNWTGLECKEQWTYKYLKEHPEVEYFVFTDAFDTFAIGKPDETLSYIEACPKKLIISAEKGCYPNPDKAKLYPETNSPFKYVNAGQFCGSSKVFIELYEANPITEKNINDQTWMTDLYLNNQDKCYLDVNCHIFQSVAFCAPSEFLLNDNLINTHTDGSAQFIHGNGQTPLGAYEHLIVSTKNIGQLAQSWQDLPEAHRYINDSLTNKLLTESGLKKFLKLRLWVEKNIFGFGERAFYPMFKLLFDSQQISEILEIGVFKGQTLALFKMLEPEANVTGITPLDTTGNYWESNYAEDVKRIHDEFNLPQPTILHGLSTNPDIIKEAGKKEYDLIYIDGDHSYNGVRQDIINFSTFVKKGGYLVLDDCACHYQLPEGMFRGHDETTRGVNSLLPNDQFKELFNVVHIRVFKKL